MTPTQLAPYLSIYAAGLEAELSLLRQVQRLAGAQQEASQHHDIERLNGIADERDRLMAGLVRIEHEIRSAREMLAEHRPAASTLTGFDDVVALHKTAGVLVAGILASDHQTMESLREAEVARRMASQALEAGENTLAAYRRVIAPSLSGPSLVDKRG